MLGFFCLKSKLLSSLSNMLDFLFPLELLSKKGLILKFGLSSRLSDILFPESSNYA
jgi:hypothetical protein